MVLYNLEKKDDSECLQLNGLAMRLQCISIFLLLKMHSTLSMTDSSITVTFSDKNKDELTFHYQLTDLTNTYIKITELVSLGYSHLCMSHPSNMPDTAEKRLYLLRSDLLNQFSKLKIIVKKYKTKK